MIELKCQDCGKALEWKGRGKKPKRCKPCGAEANRKKATKSKVRDRLHKKGESASRWNELWLLKDVFGNPYAVRRDARQVWGATGSNDEQVNGRSGIFHKIGPDGLPNEGMSIPTTTAYADVRWRISENHRLARESDEAKSWLDANPDWWHFEEHAHDLFTRDVVDSVVVNGESVEDDPDETSHRDKCTWCGERRPLVLAHEFCGDACMTDYVTTFGPDGLELEGGFDAPHNKGGMAEARGRVDAPVVQRAAA
ncbi:hypothetical protein AB0C87_24870 [Actinomadura sp. NPDC048021]|uniref:hypothetical protein n=1 Tax=Actinomadura sp. NPDC048021 TaxID=3155385 RepID=UPI0033D42B15